MLLLGNACLAQYSGAWSQTNGQKWEEAGKRQWAAKGTRVRVGGGSPAPHPCRNAENRRKEATTCKDRGGASFCFEASARVRGAAELQGRTDRQEASPCPPFELDL